MNVASQLEQNHLLVLQVIDDLPELEWDIPGVCGAWSVKDVMAHLSAYEEVLVDVFATFLTDEPTPHLAKFIDKSIDFNKSEIEARQYRTAQQVMDEYEEAQLQSSDLLAQIPQEKILQKGTLPWYGNERSLADLINNFCAHTQEHCAQIKAFRIKEPGV
ncbi:MAG TPA: DinB family protein [Ktedonobacteraceae bacterium]|nr:DinB family protein [Ktedonobacteraceae bacterium]